MRTLEGHENWIHSLALDPSGRYLASGSDDNTVRLWDVESGACFETLRGHTQGVYAVTWDAAGELIASGSADNSIRVWDRRTGGFRRILRDHTQRVNALVAHPADNLFASGSNDGTVRVWDWSTRACFLVLKKHTDAVLSLAASALFLLSGSEDKCVRIWSWASEVPIGVLDGFNQPLHFNSLSWKDSLLVSLELNGKVRVWDTSSTSPGEWWCIGSLASNASSQHGVAVTNESFIACSATDSDCKVAIWSPLK